MKRDVESGGDGNANPRPLYPAMLENPQLRWAFIRKVYTILTIQLLLTIAVASVVVFVRPIALFFVSSPGGLALYIVLLIAPLISTYIPSPLVNLLFLINKCFLSSSSFFFFYYPYDCKRIFGLLPKINVLLYNIIILSSSSSFF